jgi:hypothetical protein
MYFVSFLLFAPFMICTYNTFTNTEITHRLQEIVFSNGLFWFILIITLGASLLPLVFYYRGKSILFPSLKDLILQRRIDYE